jgi:hypothetical protein
MFAGAEITPREMSNLLNEHAPPTLRRLRIEWYWSGVPLSTIPQVTLQNLTHLGVDLVDFLPRDESCWQSLRSTSLQYFSFHCHSPNHLISLVKSTFPQVPPTLKAFIIHMSHVDPYDERYLDELDGWFCENQNVPENSVAIVAGYTVAACKSDSAQHRMWGRWAFLTLTLPWGETSCRSLCEELLPDGELTIWEEADRALEERRLRLVSQVTGATKNDGES